MLIKSVNSYRKGSTAMTSIFPRLSAPEKQLLLLDTHPMSSELRYLTAVLQGLVNRDTPKLFRLCSSQHDKHYGNVYDMDNDCWRDYLTTKGYGFKPVTLSDVMHTFGNKIEGAVLYEQSQQFELNLITMLCAQRNALPVTPRMNQELGLPVLFDARQKWPNRFAACDWACQHLWKNANQRILCSMPEHYTNLIDYAVACNMFLFYYPNWPTSRDDEYLKRVLLLTPPNTPVVGVWDLTYARAPLQNDYDQERNFIDRVSKAGKFFVVTHEADNLTVHSGIQNCKVKREPSGREPLVTGQNQITFVYSEGDNISFQMRNMPLLWSDPGRSKIPLTWSVAPAMAELCPVVLEYYLHHASDQDDFVMAMSGAGYTFPSLYGEWYGKDQRQVFDDFLHITGCYMERLGLEHVAILDHPDDHYIAPKQILAEYVAALPGLKSLWCDYPALYGKLSEKLHYTLGKDIGVFHAQNNYGRQIEHLIALKDISAASTLVYVMASGWVDLPSNLFNMATTLGDSFSLATVTEMSKTLIREKPPQAKCKIIVTNSCLQHGNQEEKTPVR